MARPVKKGAFGTCSFLDSLEDWLPRVEVGIGSVGSVMGVFGLVAAKVG
jgi:hypothetical protein